MSALHGEASSVNLGAIIDSLPLLKSKCENYPPERIYNMDETPVYFDMSGELTVHIKGEKTVHIKGTGNEKNRFTVVLTCAGGNLVIIIYINNFIVKSI